MRFDQTCKLFAAALGLAFAVVCGPASAAGDIFTVSGVEVDASGETTSDARDVALNQGRVRALEILFRRLAPQEYWDVLPAIGGADLLSMERGFQVSNEKSSSTRYLADVTYSFIPDLVREQLQLANIPFSEVQARTAVVVPLLERGGRFLLWEDENFWRLAWRSKNFVNELVPLIPALGEVEDIAAVSAGVAAAANWAGVSGLADIYGVPDVMVAKAVLEGEGTSQILLVEMQRVSASGRQNSATIRLRNTDALPLDQLADLAIEQAVAVLQTGWKEQTIVNPNAPAQSLAATIRFLDLSEWIAIRNRLESVNLIRDLNVRAVSRNGAEIVLAYSGSFDQLRVALAQRELNILSNEEINVIELASSLGEDAMSADPRAETGPDGDPVPEAPGDVEPLLDPSNAPEPDDGEQSGVIVDFPDPAAGQ